jgi:hypothetical protein
MILFTTLYRYSLATVNTWGLFLRITMLRRVAGGHGIVECTTFPHGIPTVGMMLTAALVPMGTLFSTFRVALAAVFILGGKIVVIKQAVAVSSSPQMDV